jgi:integrase
VSAPSGQAARGPAARPGLLEALMAAVRPQFRGDVLGFDPRDPVFGGPPCLARECERPGRTRGLCLWHYQQWREEKPDLAEFIATAGPQWRPRMVPSACLVPGCGLAGRGTQGLCPPHRRRYRRAGGPGLEAWLAAGQAVTRPGPAADCLVPGCGLWAQPRGPFCHAHFGPWSRQGRPDPQEFADGYGDEARLNRERIDLRALGPQMRLEWQYALQCRSDAGQVKVDPMEAQRAVSLAAAAGTASLLDWDEEQWQHYTPSPARAGDGPLNARSLPRTLVIYARQQAEGLAFGRGWDIEYPRDTWRLRNLGIDGPTAHVRFGGIPQPWLRDLAKRWSRWRLSAGISGGTAARGARVIARLGTWLASQVPSVTAIAGISRPLLERYLADLHAGLGGRKLHQEHLEHLSAFLTAVRQHDWAPGLPAGAMIFPEDYPGRGKLLPRALAGHVMAQVEDPANLDQWKEPDRRLITLILIRCGLRVGDACRLPADCVTRDRDGQPYLRYYNRKMKREALVPVDDDLVAEIARQRERNAGRWPGGIPVLFPRPTRNVDGSQPVNGDAYRGGLRRWLERCDIRGEGGQPIRVTPHQFRHSLGTALINRDVPQHVVQKILDHESAEMTAHYARLSDTTVRRHWEAARKVNIRGETVSLDPAGPLAEAAWAKQRLSRATQALPNGYCQLPVVKTCPHANACLTCPMFLTTPEFLPQHQAQHQAILQIITKAEAAGQARLAEMNKQVAGNLAKIITALEAEPGSEASGGKTAASAS